MHICLKSSSLVLSLIHDIVTVSLLISFSLGTKTLVVIWGELFYPLFSICCYVPYH